MKEKNTSVKKNPREWMKEKNTWNVSEGKNIRGTIKKYENGPKKSGKKLWRREKRTLVERRETGEEKEGAINKATEGESGATWK